MNKKRIVAFVLSIFCILVIVSLSPLAWTLHRRHA